MRQLVRFLTGHFAPHHSPSRERRELWFASPTPPPGKTPDAESGTERTNADTQESAASPDEIGRSILETGTRAKDIVGLGKSNPYESALVAGHLVYLNDIPEKTLKSIARSIIVTDEDYRQIQASVSMSDGRDYKLKNRVYAYQGDVTLEDIIKEIRPGEVSIFDWVSKHCSSTLKKAFLDKIRPLVKEQLRQSPEKTLQCIYEEEGRLRDYGRLRKDIEEMMNVNEKIVELLKEQVNVEDQKELEGTMDMRALATSGLETRIELDIRRLAGMPDIQAKLGNRLDDYFKNFAGLSDDDKLNIRIDVLSGMIRNAKKKIRRTRSFGGGEQRVLEELVEKPDEVMERMRGESDTLRLILDAQLQERAKEVFQMHCDRLERLLKDVDPQLTVEKLEQLLTTDAAQDLDRKFFAKHGFELFAMLEDFGQVRLQMMKQLRAKPPMNDKNKPLYGEPTEVSSVKFLDFARGSLNNWKAREDDLNRIAKDGSRRETEPDIIELTQEQDATEKWAHEMAKIIREIESELPDGVAWNERLEMVRIIRGIPESGKAEFLEIFQKLRNYTDPAAALALRSQPENCITAKAFPGSVQRDITEALDSLRNPRLLAAAAERAREIDAKIDSEFNTVDNAAIEEISLNTRTRLSNVIGILVPERPNTDKTDDPKRTERGLFAPLNHSVTRYLGITDRLLGRKAQLDQNLDAATEKTDQPTRRRLRSIYWVRSEVEQLERSVQMLNAIETSIIETNDIPKNALAQYDPRQDPPVFKIRPGTSRTGDEVKHEWAHAILDILTRRARLFPDLHAQGLRMLQERRKPEQKSVDELLHSLTATSYKHIRDQGLDPTVEKEKLFEELLVRYADYKEGRNMVLEENEHELFDLMQDDGRPPKEMGEPENQMSMDLKEIGTPTSQIANRAASMLMTDTGTAPEEKQVFNMREMLGDIDRALRNVNQFIYAYTKPPDFPPDLFEILKEKHKEGDKEFNDLEDIFRRKEKWTRPDLPPEDDPVLQERCQKLNDYADKLETVVVNYDNQKLDTTKQGRTLGVWESLFGGMRLASINDVVRLWNDTMEDIKDIYKRRQDSVIKDIGYGLTKPLQDSDLLKQIPGAGKYLTGLHAYHQRRYANTEQEAADKWKDGLKNEDSHTLLHFLHYTRNKDTIRGIITLLCERGEMDWNDWHVWETLNDISGYHMPVRPCLRSDVLRDTWLRKIISYIWNDKELYYHWRSENDSKTKSGKEHFVPWVDQLSNLRGGMDGELNKQLRLWNEWKKGGEVGTPPEDIKPHLFEKVIHYAISNGKMTMEQKFFYLIRGVADGILSIDRLRTLAGEEGGVLNQFPFIDYFYKKNNTLPEVQALASRLRETDDYGDDTFKPGAKTTLWIQLDLVRNKGVQERLSKGTSRTSSETIDHEDVPLFLPQLDYNSVRGMADVISGSRQKMSPEALKNLYCGYSSKFKIFGRLAQLEDKGKERFTPEDASILADAIGAYVDVDNILARRGYNAETRPTLSLSQLASAGPSSDGHTTAEYRRNMNYFVKDLVTDLQTEIEGTSHWKNYVLQNPKKAEKEKNDGSVTRAEPLSLLGDYISTDDDVIKGKISDRKSPEMGRKLFEGTPAFVAALKEILPRNISVLKRVLQKYTKNYRTADYEEGFFDEGGSKGEVTLENVEKAVIARDKARKEIMEVNEGGHH